jgi:SAM-dependent methyltransferase
MAAAFDRKVYWERKILPWEKARYGDLAWFRPTSWTLRRRMEMSARAAERVLPAGGRLLELGCGSGLLAQRLRGRFSTYHGIDLAEAAITEARARVPGPGVSFHRGDVLEAPLPPSDLAVFLGLLDWLEPREIEALFRRIPARFLLFSFTEKSRFNPYSCYRAYYDSRFGGGVYRARSFRRGRVEGWLRDVGVKRVEFLPATFFDPGRLVLAEVDAHEK